MPRKNSELTRFVKGGASELRGVVEKAIAERPMLVLGLALELGLLAGHWMRGRKISVADLAERALSSPQSFMTAIMPGTKSRGRKVASRKATARKTQRRKAARHSRKIAAAAS